MGNLTNVAYPVSHAVSLAYDVLNRLSSMADTAGTTTYRTQSSDQHGGRGGNDGLRL